jgi:hypothetical protein
MFLAARQRKVINRLATDRLATLAKRKVTSCLISPESSGEAVSETFMTYRTALLIMSLDSANGNIGWYCIGWYCYG